MDDFLSRSEFPAKLTRLRLYVERLGVTTLDAVPPSDQARFIGVFEGHTITLFPQSASPFALWFTVAHLFGHMTQIAGMNERVKRANALVLRRGQELFSRDVQLIYDHEYEAAEIGRTLVGEVEPDLPVELDVAYTRFFLADFRYLINAIETGESGPQVFQRFWRREPIPRNLIMPDARPLLDMHNIPPATESVVVI
ncbi:MAG TPA: hypothetical protein VGD61_03930 [Pyrinomonadaceae bacterium]